MRCHPRYRRRLHRPSQLRHGADRPAARSAGLSRRHPQPARLALGRSLPRAGPAEAVLRRHRRQHGFDGQPLHGRPQDPLRRRLHAERRTGQAPRPFCRRLRPALPRGLPGHGGGDRQHRGFLAPHRPLRLLVGHRAPLHPAGFEGRPAALRQRRARPRRTGASPRQRHADRRYPRPARQRLHGAARLAAGRRLAGSRLLHGGYARRRASASRPLRPSPQPSPRKRGEGAIFLPAPPPGGGGGGGGGGFPPLSRSRERGRGRGQKSVSPVRRACPSAS